MLQRFTASYANTNPNFVFLNLPENKPEQGIVFSIASVIQNILTRSVCTRPSDLLKEKLGELSKQDLLYTIAKEKNIWHSRIKGNSRSFDNPASLFFHELLPKHLGEDWSFIPNLILPETPFEEIPGIAKDDFVDQQVDFFLPQAKLAIEIDGLQHKDQQLYDQSRDHELRLLGITTLRFTTADIRSQTPQFKNNIAILSGLLKECESLKSYYNLHNGLSSTPENYSIRKTYDTIMRLELLLLCLIKSGKLDIRKKYWNLHYNGDFSHDHLSLAWQDLINWFSSLFHLAGCKFSLPMIIHSRQEPIDAKIDFSFSKRWNDEYEYNPNIIYVRNDYFDEKDYYNVQVAPAINYKITNPLIPKQQAALEFLLKNLFGYDKFRSGQVEIISRALTRQTTIGILPTGGGKSICYHIAALLQPCVSFAVCPLLSLITDQKRNLDELGMDRTGYISSEMSPVEKEKVLDSFLQRKLHIIWLSPERFQSLEFRSRLREIRDIGYAVIDEVHCLSEWGHDFRTSYLMLVKTIISNCPNAVLLGLTATASQMVREDVCREFGIPLHAVVSPYRITRDELSFHVVRTNSRDRNDDLISILNQISEKYNENIFAPSEDKENQKCGIIFTILKSASPKSGLGTRYVADKLKKELTDKSCAIDVYDSSVKDRQAVQDRYLNNEFPLLVATKAFGMGVNKKNIRYTVHFGVPWSVEAFYQEAGRAGRDSRSDRNQSDCYILYDNFHNSEALLEKIFSLDTSVEEIAELQTGLGNSDIGSILWLWKLNNDGVEEELRCMTRVLKLLHRSVDGVISCEGYRSLLVQEGYSPAEVRNMQLKPKMEKALYRLCLLGLVGDWTFDNWSPENAIIRVFDTHVITKADEAGFIFDKMIEYIRRYDREFTLDSKALKYEPYRKIAYNPEYESKPVRRYMKCLLQWTYDNIVYSRKMAISNMLDLLRDYEKNQDELAFKKALESRFAVTGFSDVMLELTYHPNDLDLWISAVEYEDIDQAIATASQYIESYRNNSGLDYALSILQLIKGRHKAFGIKERLRSAFNAASALPEGADSIINFALKRIKNTSLECREILAEALLETHPEKAQYIQDELEDRVSLAYLLNGILLRMKNYERSL